PMIASRVARGYASAIRPVYWAKRRCLSVCDFLSGCITHCLLIHNKDCGLAYISMRRVMLQAKEEAQMDRKGWTIIIAMIVGAIIGAVIGYLAGQSALGSALGAVVGVGTVAIGSGLIV